MSADAAHGGLAEDHEEHENHEAWVIPYADMLTLLMALFMMLFAISRVDLAKFEELKIGLGESLGGGFGILGAGDAAVQDPDATADGRTPATTGEATRAAVDGAQVLLLDRITAAIAGMPREAQVSVDARGVVITLAADQVLFTPGASTLTPRGAALAAEIGRSLAGRPDAVLVEGHTDDVPYPASSNWELSAMRATAVLHQLQAAGVAPGRLAAIGHADTTPVASNRTDAGRAANRRVEIVLVTEAPAPPVEPAPPSTAGPAVPFGVDLVQEAFARTASPDGASPGGTGTGTGHAAAGGH